MSQSTSLLAVIDQCHYCGAPNPTTKDHVVPKDLGGTNARVNLVPACFACNMAKDNKWPDVDHYGNGRACPVCAAAVGHFRQVERERRKVQQRAAEQKTVYNHRSDNVDLDNADPSIPSNMVKLLWHVWVKGHSVRTNRHISIPVADTSRGWLHVCECGMVVSR